MEHFNEGEISKCFILYVDEPCDSEESEAVCNTKCIHCYYRFAKQRMKTFEALKSEVDESIRKGTNHIQITGGEPTIHQSYFELIAYIKSKGVMCSVITNGFLLSNKDFILRAKEFVDYYLLSFHGGEEEIVNKVMGNKRAWIMLNQAMDYLDEEKIEFHINCTVFKTNYESLSSLVTLLNSKNQCKRVNFICFNPWESFNSKDGKESVTDLIVSYDDMAIEIEKACLIAKKNNIDFAIRYFPFCKLSKELWPYLFNYSTMIFDNNEWNYEMWFPKEFSNIQSLYQLSEKYKLEGTMEQRLLHGFGRFWQGFRTNFTTLNQCKTCSHFLICDSPHKKQLEYFKNQQFNKIEGKIIRDSGYYVKNRFLNKRK